MFLKPADKKDKNTGKIYRYYKLCDSYRIGSQTRHRTILNLGKLEDIETQEERKLLADRIDQLLRGVQLMFETNIPEHIEKSARFFYEQVMRKGLLCNPIKKTEVEFSLTKEEDYETVDLSSVNVEDAREIGCEWLCKQAIEELKLHKFLKYQGWEQSEIDTALIHIISKATYPASEHKTAQWIEDNSAIAELFGKSPSDINRFDLYKISDKLYFEKTAIESFLSNRTNELFDLQDKIIICDLTNTYFEGVKQGSKLAQYSRSKEKRSDAKLVAMALVINEEGFPKYSDIFRGNIADCEVLEDIVEKMSVKTSTTGRRPIVVIDAGIATEENLKMLRDKGYEYVCVTRSKLKEYELKDNNIIQILDNKKQKIEVCWVDKPDNTDKFLYVKSQMKELKERSMSEHFSKRYEQELENLSKTIHKKGATKKHDKIMERIGRIKERYPRANKHYSIDVKVEDGIVVDIKWKQKQLQPKSPHGVYFLRTHVESDISETRIWDIYNTIREVENSFRILKTDLQLRPVFHQNDSRTEAHLFLAILAYTIVNTIRFRLKKQDIRHDWSNVVRIMNTQKASTVTMNNRNNKKINIRVCSLPTAKTLEIYNALGYKTMPFYRKKFVFPEC